MDSEVVVSAFQDDSLGSDDAIVIAEKIKKGELDAKTVTRDAIRRAESVNPKLNAITEENFIQLLEVKAMKIKIPAL